MTQENAMQFPFETKTEDGLKATVLGTMPDGRLAGFVRFGHGHVAWDWNADGSDPGHGQGVTLPLQIKPLTTYRMRCGGTAWTSGLIEDGWVHGITNDRTYRMWRVSDGRWAFQAADHPNDLIEELRPGTTD